jgi:hypothetical protein
LGGSLIYLKNGFIAFDKHIFTLGDDTNRLAVKLEIINSNHNSYLHIVSKLTFSIKELKDHSNSVILKIIA